MALVKFDLKELERFALQKLSQEKLESLIPDLGFPVEGFEEGQMLADITPDRLDLISAEGLGRAIASFTGKKAGLRAYAAKPSGISISTDKSVSSVRPFIVGAVVRNISIDEPTLLSLINLQEKIHDTFGRKRRRASIGVHNLDAVKPPFTYKAAAPDSVSFIPLDFSEPMTLREILEKHPKGIDYAFTLEGKKAYPLVLDSENNILSLPPIINGELTRVSDSTKNLFIEITGTSLHAANDVLNIICCALADRGASVESIKCGALTTPDFTPAKKTLSLDAANTLLGTKLSAGRVALLLAKMGFGAKPRGASIDALVPPYRVDILHEVDLIEDAAIALGYNSLELSPELPSFPTIAKPLQAPLEEGARACLCGLGFLEAMNNTLSSQKANFDALLLPRSPSCELMNPLTEDATMLRTHLLPSLLLLFEKCKSEKTPQRVFEIGFAFDAQGRETTRIAVAELDASSSYSSIRSIADALFAELRLKAEFTPAAHPSFIPGRCAKILIEKKEAGFIGEIHPQVLNNFGLEQPTSAFEITLH